MRNVQKSIDAYKTRFCGTQEGRFYLSDFRQIMEMSRDITQADTVFNVADNCFMFAFMVGYRKALSEQKESACR